MENDTQKTPMVSIENLHKSFGTLEVLKGIDLNVNTHEVIGIIGASGSGKSTMLRCINNLETPTKGQIFIDGKIMGKRENEKISHNAYEKRLDQMRQQVGMVFQRFNLFPH